MCISLPSWMPPRIVLPILTLVLLGSLTFLAAQRRLAPADGEEVYQRQCSTCHDSGNPRVPQRDALKRLTAERIRRTLDFGTMLSVGNLLNRAEREAVAEYLGREGSAIPEATEAAYCEDRSIQLPRNVNTGDTWNGWSPEPTNTRYQTGEAAGLNLDQVRNLELKWAYGFDGDTMAFSQPTVVDGYVFVGSASGQISALDAKTGCLKWTYQARAAVRVAPNVVRNGDGHALLFGDQIGWFYKLNAATGRLLWQVQTEEHESTRLTGAATVNNGIVYIPIASWEETRALRDGYACCTFRGSVLAVRVSDGRRIWKTYMIPEAPTRRGETPEGWDKWGPSGAGVWSAPTLDLERGVLYVGTGDNYSEPATNTSDAIVALNMTDGKILWSQQTTPDDIFNGYCYTRDRCDGSPDFDYGASPVLIQDAGDGKSILLAGQKSGVVYALDPDHNGEILWQARVGKGGYNGGVQWGMASDGRLVYAANSDVGRSTEPREDPDDPRPVPFDPTQGGGLSALRITDGERVWYADPPVCPPDAVSGCSPAQSSAVTAIPGVVFSAALDGHLRAYSAEDGTVIWDFDTVRSYDTVNGIPATGGSIDGPGPTVADGMVFINSGYSRTGGIAGNVLLAFGPAE